MWRSRARVAAEPIVTPSHVGVPSEAHESASAGGQRLFGSEPEGELAELSQSGGAVAAADDEPAAFAEAR